MNAPSSPSHQKPATVSALTLLAGQMSHGVAQQPPASPLVFQNSVGSEQLQAPSATISKAYKAASSHLDEHNHGAKCNHGEYTVVRRRLGSRKRPAGPADPHGPRRPNVTSSLHVYGFHANPSDTHAT